MEPSKAISKVSEILTTSHTESLKILENTLKSSDPESSLFDLLGFDNFELVSYILTNRTLFIAEDVKNEDGNYIEITIPKVESIHADHKDLLPTNLVKDHKKYFSYEFFNIAQSQVFEKAYNSDDNLLICAPTGAGKTDMALLAILRALQTKKEGTVVYIVPMKALATEITFKYKKVFKENKLVEFTGDTEVGYKEASEADIIICTPEKLDVATRKLNCCIKKISLVVIDEIHLLEDDRGPVIESLVCRMLRFTEMEQRMIRIVGLSATLPNYRDVGKFVRAENVFFFDSMYRPVPLQMAVVGFKKASKYSDQLDYLFEKISFFRQKGKQVLIFVHSRSKTSSLAKLIIENSTLNVDLKNTNVNINSNTNVNANSNTNSNTNSNANVNRNSNANFHELDGAHRYFVSNKVGIHHAGLPRKERLKMESLFREGKIDVLVTTSTLAWGVNLPAHCVVVFGTSVYQNGKFTDIGILDILQIFGRAGRPQYDTEGYAFLITQSNKIDKYLAQLKRSSDIESKMLAHVADCLCAEIYLGTVNSMSTALSWIKNTFLYIRMLKNPAIYGLLSSDVSFEEQALSEYVYLTVKRLEECGLVIVTRVDSNYNTWTYKSSIFGRICSTFYLSHITMHTWLLALSQSKNTQELEDEISILKLLFKSEEFKNVVLREEEVPKLLEIHKDLLLKMVIDFEYEDSSKTLLLLIAYLNYIPINLFSLTADTNYIIENLQRLISAFKEVLIYYKRFDIFRIVSKIDLERKSAKITGEFGVKCIGLVKDFIFLNISTAYDEVFIIFAYEDDKIIGVFEFNREFTQFIKARNIKVVIEGGKHRYTSDIIIQSDYSLYGLYKFGSHCCETQFNLSGIQNDCIHFIKYDSKQFDTIAKGSNAISKESNAIAKGSNIITDLTFAKNCYSLDKKNNLLVSFTGESYNNLIDIKFALNFELVPVYNRNYKENLKSINQLIFNLHLEQPFLIICPTKEDTLDTIQDLNTMTALQDITKIDSIELFSSSSTKRVLCFSDFYKSPEIFLIRKELDNKNHTDYSKYIVIFKCCSSNKNYYPINDIFKISNGRKTVIYEQAEFLEYLSAII